MRQSSVGLEKALTALRRRKHRITGPRRDILAVLAASHGPFTIEQIHKRLKKESCDLVTVYRNLATLEELGLVRRCDFGDGTCRYELQGEEDHHHHIICRVCSKVETIDLCVADALEQLARQMGYTSVTHSTELFGVCPKCRKARAG
ncbi:MAG TPA: Fur family transcriptional regulator [Verrucomicrobiae bacterium]|nr:Fur family transcriptional regulator [Verrucomicrobiae bacterium]